MKEIFLVIFLLFFFASLTRADTPPGRNINIVNPASSPVPVYQPNDSVLTGSVTAADTATTSVTQPSGQVWYSGTPTPNSAATFTVASWETAMVEVSGTFAGTLQFEVSEDVGANWQAHSIHQLSGPFFPTTCTGPLVGSLNVAAKNWFRVRATSSTFTGTANIIITLSNNPSSIYIANSLKIVDGSQSTASIPFTIKPGSTPSLLTDSSAVITQSPYSFLNISTKAAFQVKTGAGILSKVCMNNGVNNASFALYDGTSTSGTPIATVTQGGGVSANFNPGCMDFGFAQFTTGLYVNVTTASNLTVIFK